MKFDRFFEIASSDIDDQIHACRRDRTPLLALTDRCFSDLAGSAVSNAMRDVRGDLIPSMTGYARARIAEFAADPREFAGFEIEGRWLDQDLEDITAASIDTIIAAAQKEVGAALTREDADDVVVAALSDLHDDLYGALHESLTDVARERLIAVTIDDTKRLFSEKCTAISAAVDQHDEVVTDTLFDLGWQKDEPAWTEVQEALEEHARDRECIRAAAGVVARYLGRGIEQEALAL